MRALFLFLLVGLCLRANAAATDSASKKYVGFDANPLLSQVLPLNRVILSSNTFAITTRRFWGNDGFRACYGIGLGEELEVQFFQLMVGYENRRKISNRWYFFSGVDMILRASSEETTSGSLASGQAQGFGAGGHWGAEFTLGKVLSFSTEASLRLLVNLDDGGASFLLVPPINLTAHFNISKK